MLTLLSLIGTVVPLMLCRGPNIQYPAERPLGRILEAIVHCLAIHAEQESAIFEWRLAKVTLVGFFVGIRSRSLWPS